MNGCLTLTPSLGVISYEYRYRLYLQKLDRLFILPNAENRTTVSSFVWTEHRNVTDRQTDGHRPSVCLSHSGVLSRRPTVRQNRSGYYNGLYCEQCGRAVKPVGVCTISVCQCICVSVCAHSHGRIS